MRGTLWTPAEDEVLREMYATEQPGAILAELMRRCGSERNSNSLNQRARKLGLRKAEGYVKPGPPRTFWTDDKREWFASFVPGHTEHEISAEHERIYGTPLSESQISNAKTVLGVLSGTHGGQFQKGHAGGFVSEEHRRAFMEAGKRTRFAKGTKTNRGREKPLGYERADSNDGHIMVKVRDKAAHGKDGRWGTFEPRARVVWEKHNGPVPKGSVVIHVNGDNTDDRIENLRCVTNAVHRRLNSRYMMAHKTEETMDALIGIARIFQKVSEMGRGD